MGEAWASNNPYGLNHDGAWHVGGNGIESNAGQVLARGRGWGKNNNNKGMIKKARHLLSWRRLKGKNGHAGDRPHQTGVDRDGFGGRKKALSDKNGAAGKRIKMGKGSILEKIKVLIGSGIGSRKRADRLYEKGEKNRIPVQAQRRAKEGTSDKTFLLGGKRNENGSGLQRRQ